MDMSTRALVTVWQHNHMAAELKQLALLFDEILYIPPHGFVLSNELLTDTSRFKQVENDNTYIDGFSYARDVVPGFSVPDPQLKGDGLAETVTLLRSASVMRPIQFAPGVWKPLPDDLVCVMHSLWSSEMEDDSFLRCTGTDRGEFDKPIEMGHMRLLGKDGREHTTVWVNPPAAFNVSSDLTMQAYYAEKMDATPVLLSKQFREAWAHRAKSCLNLVHLLGRHGDHVQAYVSTEHALGAAGYWLSGLLFGSELVDHLNTSDVLKLRKALDEPRRDFVSRHLARLAQMIQDNPWSDKAMDRIRTYVRTELMPDVQRFNQEGKALREEALGKLGVRFAEMAVGITAGGGGAGGLAGALLTGSSFWTLFILGAAGAAAGAARVAPRLVSDLVDLSLESRKRHRNGLFYISSVLQHSGRIGEEQIGNTR